MPATLVVESFPGCPPGLLLSMGALRVDGETPVDGVADPALEGAEPVAGPAVR
jgi:hypothetical protein